MDPCTLARKEKFPPDFNYSVTLWNVQPFCKALSSMICGQNDEGVAITSGKQREKNRMQKNIGVLSLDGLMSRACIVYTSGYTFKGKVNLQYLEKSFHFVVDNLEKFRHQLYFETQDNICWQPRGDYGKRFFVIEHPDIEKGFSELCCNSIKLFKESKCAPMMLAVIHDNGGQDVENRFIIAHISEHTHADARGAIVIFDKIVQCYNALIQNDQTSVDTIIESVKKIKTLENIQFQKKLVDHNCDHDSNASLLADYPLVDAGGHAIPIDTIPECLTYYRQQKRTPNIKFLDIKKIVAECRKVHPEVSRNSVICAVLSKAVFNLNVSTKKNSPNHQISFRVVVDLLTPELRQQLLGNYIAFVPYTVHGEKSIEDIAREINDRTLNMQQQRFDLTAFSAVEDAVQKKLVGTFDDPISFIVTSWDNYFFLGKEDYLAGCWSIEHRSGVNIEPKDVVGAALVNKPVLVTNLSQDDKFCLSFFPSLRSDKENMAIAEHIEAILDQGCRPEKVAIVR